MTECARGTPPWPLLALAGAAFLFGACGDVTTFKLSPGEFGESEPAERAGDWDGVIVELKHVADGCEPLDEGLRAFVSDEMEFHNCAVTVADSCGAASQIPVAVDIQARSIIYDFSNIEEEGSFEGSDFNGYVLMDVLRLAPPITAASIDREHTTLDLEELDIVIEDGSIHINFAGLDFDHSDFVKVDLEFAEIEPL